METGATSLAVAVVKAVADAEGVDPVDLSSPLAYTVDPDALDTLFRAGTGRVTFDYCGYLVAVDADRTVEVSPLKEA